MKRNLLTILLALLLAACSGGAPSNSEFVIPEGASVRRAATIMEDAGAIEDADAFVRHVRLFGGSASIKPGEYAVRAGTSQSDVLAMLQAGRVIQHMVMVPEGMPSIMVYDRLMANPLLTGSINVPAEGSILPDSYAIRRGESRAAVVARMQAAMDRAFARAWAERSPNAVPTNRVEAMTLASIIEKETAKASERRRVAAVYSNRLRRGIMLQADPTIIYPITRGKALGRRIRRSEIDAVNDYNTYTMRGLPVGPIANPGQASIRAALNPESSDYLYFVADGTGGHIFARTLAEHNRNVARWRAIRRERGEI
ncbi:MAG: endolytic transglycosylase MltG [Sphingomonadaceae bacterium]|nr:endolytic transglycosylase MltG [Sphingomonadaceae bacterium]